MLLHDQEIAARANRILRSWEDAVDNDSAVLAAINRAIQLQTGDNDSPSDAKVMAALRAAKSAQEADIKEG